jgi:hypothetical protein
MLSSQGFEKWMTALGERWFPLSKPSKAAYWHHLHRRFENDAQFEAICIELFALDQKHFPTPTQFLDALRQFQGPEYQPPALPAAAEDYTPPPWWHEVAALYKHFAKTGWRWIQHSPTEPTVYVLEMDLSNVVFTRTADGIWESDHPQLNEMVLNVLARHRPQPAKPFDLKSAIEGIAKPLGQSAQK